MDPSSLWNTASDVADLSDDAHRAIEILRSSVDKCGRRSGIGGLLVLTLHESLCFHYVDA